MMLLPRKLHQLSAECQRPCASEHHIQHIVAVGHQRHLDLSFLNKDILDQSDGEALDLFHGSAR